MKIFTHTLENTAPEDIGTEIRFVIASARACGNELIYVKIESEIDGKVSTALLKHLKTIKKQGRIDFFAGKDAFADINREASYLINKFPDVVEYIGSDSSYFIIKM